MTHIILIYHSSFSLANLVSTCHAGKMHTNSTMQSRVISNKVKRRHFCRISSESNFLCLPATNHRYSFFFSHSKQTYSFKIDRLEARMRESFKLFQFLKGAYCRTFCRFRKLFVRELFRNYFFKLFPFIVFNGNIEIESLRHVNGRPILIESFVSDKGRGYII